ncbi:uncharacterized protein EV154DRAFT_574820 [Mucor mucedo]|uniref:uncharacterized protein n=1 Tax=Mucor mucedo TaxID=29922 RepID=UPI00221E3CF3|nr:uncharacterized protein EV154DRAFT_574820 [Mucor mucedo]KAI7883833.1 hypothetical protein EV154DRAFT_574820 [Mucor mucedo]
MDSLTQKFFDLTVKKSTVYSFLKNECNLSFKTITQMPIARNSPIKIQARKDKEISFTSFLTATLAFSYAHDVKRLFVGKVVESNGVVCIQRYKLQPPNMNLAMVGCQPTEQYSKLEEVQVECMLHISSHEGLPLANFCKFGSFFFITTITQPLGSSVLFRDDCAIALNPQNPVHQQSNLCFRIRLSDEKDLGSFIDETAAAFKTLFVTEDQGVIASVVILHMPLGLPHLGHVNSVATHPPIINVRGWLQCA